MKAPAIKTDYKFLFAATLLFGAMIIFLIAPLYNNIVFEKRDLAQKKMLLLLLKKGLDNKLKMASANALVDEVAKDMAILQDLFLAKNRIEQIIEWLENAANELKIDIKIKIEESVGNIIMLNLELEAGYNNINVFLKNIEQAPYAITIDLIKLERNSPLNKTIPDELLEEPIAENKIKGSVRMKIYTKEFLNEKAINQPSSN